MAKFKKPTTGRLAGNQSTGNPFKPTDLVTKTQTAVRSNTKISALTDLHKLSMGTTLAPKGIQFGSPSGAGVKSRTSSSTENQWTNLLKSAASGGVTSLLGGGFLESGIDSLLSGLTSLFDGGSTQKSETPLLRFALPDSQQDSMYINSEGLSSNSSNVADTQSARSTGIYGSLQSQEMSYKQSEIVKAVKSALLTSSTLNDIIAEI